MEHERLTPDGPWPGLESYPESGAAYFHGRDEEVRRLLYLVTQHPLALLHGESGLGKTSLLQAGAFPRLRQLDLLPVLVRLDHAPGALPYGEQVRRAIAATIATHRVEGPGPAADVRLWEWVHDPATVLWSARQTPLTPVLVFDQFEELFTIGGGLRNAATREFVDELAELVLDRPPERTRGSLDRFERDRPSVPVLLSFREEFLADVEELLPQFGPLLQVRLRLTALTVERAVAAVVAAGSAARAEGTSLVTPEVSALVVQQVAGGRNQVEPSLLSMYCRELNERRIADGHAAITSDLVRTAGAAVLPRYYERCIDDLPQPVIEFVEERLLTEGQRRNIVALEDALVAPGLSRELLELLVGRRLVRIEERFGAERVELTHDVLAPIVGAARVGRRAEREERRLGAELAAQKAASAESDRQKRRWRRLTLLAVSGMMAAGLGLGTTILQRTRVEAAEAVARDQAKRAGLVASEAFLRRAATEDQRVSDVESLARRLAAARETPESGVFRSAVVAAMSRIAPTLLVGHRLPVVTIAFTPDGGRVATRDVGGTVWLWNPKTGASVGNSLGGVTSLAFSPDSRNLATAESWFPSFGRVRFWNVSTREETAGSYFERGVSEVRYGTEGQPVALTTSPTTLQLWNAAPLGPRMSTRDGSPSPLGALLRTESATAVTQRFDSRWLAAVQMHGQRTLLFDAITGDAIGAPLLGDGASATSFGFSPEGRLFVALEESTGTLQLWNTVSGSGRQSIRHVGVRGWAFRPDGARVATWDEDHVIRQWDPATGAPIGVPIMHDGGLAVGLVGAPIVYSADGCCIAIASGDSSVTVRHSMDGSLVRAPVRHPDAITALGFDASGRYLATASRDGLVQVTAISPVGSLGGAMEQQTTSSDGFKLFAMSSDGRHLAVSVDSDRTLQVIDADSGAPEGPALRYASRVTAAEFSPDGRTIAAVVDRTRIAAISLGSPSGLQIGNSIAVDGRVFGRPVFTPDGKRIAVLLSGSVRFWNIETEGLEDAGVRHELADFVAFSPDNETIVTISRCGDARIWRRESGSPVGEALWHEPPLPPSACPFVQDRIVAASFSPDGSRLATASLLGTVRFWDVQSATPVGVPLRHAGAVVALTYRPEGDALAVALRDGSVHLWDAYSGAPVTEPLRTGSNVLRLAFDDSGRRLIIALADGRTTKWELNPMTEAEAGDLLDLAEVIAGIRYVGLEATEPVPDRAARYQAWRERAAQWADAPPGSFREFAHWFFMDRSIRPPLPGMPPRAP